MEKNRDSMMHWYCPFWRAAFWRFLSTCAKQGKDRSAHVRGIAENHQGICKRDNGIGGQVYEV